MPEWWPLSNTATQWIGASSALMFIATLVGIPWVVARVRADYFTHSDPPAENWLGRYPAVRLLLRILKNVLGVALVLVGIVLSMPLVPGQGLLTILLGVMLLDFPGKRRFEIWLARKPAVNRSINWIRRKSNKPPLEIPASTSESD